MFGVHRWTVPTGFDADVYLALNPDVQAAHVNPKRHYIRHGRAENRPYARGVDGSSVVREKPQDDVQAYSRLRCLSGLDVAHGRGLEIGPLDRPLVTPGTGAIFYADHLSTEALVDKYANDAAVQIENLCKVDFDLSTMPLQDAALDGAFDYVVASHVIEHVPDLVGWLRDIEAILTDEGTLALVIPDKRFTFDLFRRESTPWMVDLAVDRKRPEIDVVLEYLINVVAIDAGALWAGEVEGSSARPIHSAQTCLDTAARHAAGEYIDVHCWVFTPSSFVTLIGDVVKQHGLSFTVALFETTAPGELEFLVQLKKTGSPAAG